MKTWSLLVSIYLLCSTCVLAQVASQSYGHEWIQEDQQYFKFKVDRDGIFRITITELRSAGVPVDQITGNQLQIFSLGQEVPLRITSDGILSDNDIIEFYGQANDGSVDALLYEDPDNQQLNPFISLYSHSRPYFLTWSDGGGARYEVRSNGLENEGLPPQEPYYIHREIIQFDDFHHKPSHDGRNFIRYSSMDYAEGYGSDLEGERTVRIPVEKLAPFGVEPKLVMRFGTNVFSKDWNVSTDFRSLKNVLRRGYGIANVVERFPLDDLSNGEFEMHIRPLGEERAKHSIARIELHYPRKYEFDGDVEIAFHQQASILSRYIEIKGFGGSRPILYNLNDQIYLYPEQDGDIIKFITKEAFQEHKWILIDQILGTHSISNLEKVDLTERRIEGNYLILSHSKLIASGTVQSYADYRASEAGGNYNVAVIDIQNVINRYAYGIKGHPIGIKNMMRFLKDQNRLPSFTFIIGKSREYTDIKDGIVDHEVVPTFGIPGSDNLLLAFDGARHPQAAIGRLAAKTPRDVTNYLEKIKTHENPKNENQTIEDQSWKKEVVHLSGGSAGNQATLYRFLNQMGEVLSYNTFGADVFTFRKTTADPILRSSAENIMNRIDAGASLLTFFGHSAVGTFDFSLEDPSKYDNAGRNPVILSLGCHSGNIHTAGSGISEDFVLEKDRGSIAFIASSGTAYPQPQFDTGINFYDLLGGEMYGHPIGEIIQKSLEARTNNPSLAVQTLIEQLTLHGDPAYKLGSFKGPDFIIDDSTVAIEDGILDATTQSFTLTFDIVNIGAVIDDVLDIQIVHLLPNGTPVDTQIVSIPAPAYNATVSIDLDNPGDDWIGANRLHISIDAQQTIKESPDELAESNNEYIAEDGKKGLEFFVFDNSAKPVIPSNYGILTEASFSLYAAVNNGLNPGGKFVLQIDTTEYFDSPLLVEEMIENVSSIIEWKPGIEEIQNTVYYWRIAPIEDSGPLKSSSWQSSSFIFLPESQRGWNQSHFFQLTNSDFHKMKLPVQSRQLEYTDRLWDIRIKNEIRTDGDFWVFVNNTPWASLNPRNQGALVSVFAWDRQNVIFKNNGDDYGSIPFSTDGFVYDMMNIADVKNLIKLIEAIPNGSRVFFHTMLESETDDLNVALWDDAVSPEGLSLMDVLESNGAQRVRELLETGTVPYTLVFDKGESRVIEDIANHVLETVDLSSTAKSIWPNGKVKSVAIERSGRWLRLLWEEEKEADDETMLYVLGVRSGGLRDTLKRIQNDYSVNLTSIDPAKYPKLELLYDTKDSTNKTAPQLKYWRVISNPLPDAAFYTKASSFAIQDTVNAGEQLVLDFDMINLTDVGMEPVLIRYTLIDENYREKIILRRAGRLEPNSIVNTIERISTDKLAGNYRLVVEINPNNELDELTNCNNLGFTSFYVRPDRRNPFLDVTFDGKHIFDGEVVPSRPEIVVSLRDDNSFVLLDNPEDFDITLYYPEVFVWNIDSTSSAVKWVPATSTEENIARFVITPNLNQNGTYTLEVQAKDIAGNLAGAQTYRITFEISLSEEFPKLTVSPNPMTAYTDFEYYHDTDVDPEIFKLLIYSSDGKLIKIVDKSDFGGINKGLNTYRWYGVTDYGEALTTGVYYYEFVNNVDNQKEKQKGSVLMVR